MAPCLGVRGRVSLGVNPTEGKEVSFWKVRVKLPHRPPPEGLAGQGGPCGCEEGE